MAYNNEYLTAWPSGQNKKAPTSWLYASTGDALATIIASGYFNDEVYRFKTGTLLYVQDSTNVVALLKVTVTGTTVTTDVIVQEGATAHIIAAGIHTTVGGAAAEDITVTGAVATDVVSVVLHTVGATPRTVDRAEAGTDKVTVTFSGDPSTDHKVNYIVTRAI